MSAALVAVDHVSVCLQSRLVIDDVTADFSAGEMVAVVGPNGAGKSTLLKLVARSLRLASGRVWLDGVDLACLAQPEIARQVAYLPQDRAIHWPMAVGQIVGLGRLPHQMARTTTAVLDAKAIAAAMQRMDVAQFAERSVLALSGGEQARVLMARALAQETRVLLADEPTAGLDLGHQLALMQCLRAQADAGGCVLVALHDLSLAARFADRVIVLAAGRIVAAGHPREILTAARLAAVYRVELTVAEVGGVPVFVPR